MINIIKELILESIAVKQSLSQTPELLQELSRVSEVCVHCYNQGGKVLFGGNGGSAADAQHLAAELSGRFYLDRPALFAEALHVNTSYITAVANDYGYEMVFSRLVAGIGKKGDILFLLSTSGNSANIVAAASEARKIGMIVVGMTGQSGGRLASHCDFLLNVPSNNTPRIQEAHMLMGHIICQLTEQTLFGKKS